MPMSRLFGEDAVSGDERKGNITVDTGQDELWFVTPKTFPERHYDKNIDADLALPRLAALTLSVADPQVDGDVPDRAAGGLRARQHRRGHRVVGRGLRDLPSLRRGRKRLSGRSENRPLKFRVTSNGWR